MRVTLEGQVWRVVFRHYVEFEHAHGQGMTACLLLPDTTDPEPRCVGLAFCSASDQFCRAIGRKEATKALIWEVRNMRQHVAEPLPDFSRRSVRRELWRAVLNGRVG